MHSSEKVCLAEFSHDVCLVQTITIREQHTKRAECLRMQAGMGMGDCWEHTCTHPVEGWEVSVHDGTGRLEQCLRKGCSDC